MKKILFILILSISLNILADYNPYYSLTSDFGQPFHIPEDVNNGDYVDYYKGNLTWGGSTQSFYIVTNYYDAFAINSSTGLLTINDATHIDGQISEQDVQFKLLIAAVSLVPFRIEYDTAYINIKENSYCKFINTDWTGTESGTRVQPYNDIDDVTITVGYGYFFMRGTAPKIENETVLSPHIATAAHPTIIGAYGTGTKPTTNGNNVTGEGYFFLGNSSDQINGRCEYIYFSGLKVRNFDEYFCKVYRTSNHINFYNLDIYNCNRAKVEASVIISTSSYADSSATNEFIFVNCIFDTTAIESATTNDNPHIKHGSGLLLVFNCFFDHSGNATYPGASVRFTCGNHGVIKHSYIHSPWANEIGIQVRADYITIENCYIEGHYYGIALTAPTGYYEMMPDYVEIINTKIYNTDEFGITVINIGTSSFSCENLLIEDNWIESCVKGIETEYCRKAVIRRNRIINNLTSGYSSDGDGGGDKEMNIMVYSNILYGNGTEVTTTSSADKMSFLNNTIDGTMTLNATNDTVGNCFYRSLTGASVSFTNKDLDSETPANIFYDYPNKDFRLKPDTRGDAGTIINLNLDHRFIKYNFRDWPIGAHEYNEDEYLIDKGHFKRNEVID